MRDRTNCLSFPLYIHLASTDQYQLMMSGFLPTSLSTCLPETPLSLTLLSILCSPLTSPSLLPYLYCPSLQSSHLLCSSFAFHLLHHHSVFTLFSPSYFSPVPHLLFSFPSSRLPFYTYPNPFLSFPSPSFHDLLPAVFHILHAPQ